MENDSLDFNDILPPTPSSIGLLPVVLAEIIEDVDLSDILPEDDTIPASDVYRRPTIQVTPVELMVTVEMPALTLADLLEQVSK